VGGGIEGLVHISEMAGHHVESPEQVAEPGEELWVKIIDVDLQRRRISLSIKQAAEGGEVSEEYREAFGEHAYDEHGNYIGYDYAGVGFTPETEAQAAWIDDGGEGPVAEGAVEGTVVEGTVAEGSVVEGTVVEGPVAEGPVAEGSVVEGTVVEGPVVEGRAGGAVEDTGDHADPPEAAQYEESSQPPVADEASPQGPVSESLPPEG
jgi:predicted RNA-binding protein with RPS1 domain